MKRLCALGFVGVVLASATGCSGPDSLMKEYIANINAYAETIEKKESKEKQQAALDRVRATEDKLNKLKLNKDEQDALLKKHESERKAALKRLKEAQGTQAMEGGSPGAVPEPFGEQKPKP